MTGVFERVTHISIRLTYSSVRMGCVCVCILGGTKTLHFRLILLSTHTEQLSCPMENELLSFIAMQGSADQDDVILQQVK